MENHKNLDLFLHRSSSIYYAVLGNTGMYSYVNPLYEKTFGPFSPDPGAYGFSSVIAPEDTGLFLAVQQECLASPGDIASVDLRKRRADGGLLLTRWECCALMKDNEVAGLQCIGRDLADSRVETKKSAAGNILDLLLNSTDEGFILLDKNLKVLSFNKEADRKMIQLFNMRLGKDKSIFDFALPERRGMLKELYSDVLNGEERESSMHIHVGDKTVFYTHHFRPAYDANGNIAGVVITSLDHTERKKAEESLRVSIEKFNILSKAANDIIRDWDLVSGKIQWNEAIKSFGFDPKQITPDFQWWKDHIHPEDRERIASGIEAHIENGTESWQDQYRFICEDGSFRFVIDRGFIFFDKSGNPYRMMGVMVDVSDRIRMQEELAQYDIARQRQITEAAILAQEKQRAEIGRELHDNINQILTTTKLYIDMAINEEELRDELMKKSYQNISAVIQEIRTLSKSLVPPSLGDIGLKEAIYEMIENLNISRKITIRLRTSGFTSANIPDRIKLVIFRIVQEQVNNVIKHSKATNAEIKLAVSKENLNITVTDNGLGFDTKRKIKGIGLTNITSRAEAYNGQVEIFSSPGNGCSLRVSIPI